jgi:hypothetical protein
MTTRTRITAQLFPPLILVEVETTVHGRETGTLPPSSRGPGLAKCRQVIVTDGKAVVA